MKRHILSASAMLLLLTGCLWNPYRETVYYDIIPADTVPAGNTVYHVADLRNCSGTGSRFQYKDADGKITGDPDRKWVMQPGALVARSIRLALAAPADSTGVRLRKADSARQVYVRGELLAFETDMDKKVFSLHARLHVTPTGAGEHLLDCNIRIPMQDTAPESITRAAGEAIGKIVEQLKKVR